MWLSKLGYGLVVKDHLNVLILTDQCTMSRFDSRVLQDKSLRGC